MNMVFWLSIACAVLAVVFAVGSFRAMYESRTKLQELRSEVKSADVVVRNVLDDIHRLEPSHSHFHARGINADLFETLARKEFHTWLQALDDSDFRVENESYNSPKYSQMISSAKELSRELHPKKLSAKNTLLELDPNSCIIA